MKYTIKDIVEIGIFVGLALVLNLHVFSIHIASNAGSISFSLIPLFVIALRKEWWKTLIATAIIYGLFACLMDGYGFQYYPFDYFFAYGGITVVSIARHLILTEKKSSYFYLSVFVILATVIRFFASSLSSIIFYQFTFVAALIYNAPYIFMTGGVSLAVLIILFKPLKIINQKYPSTKEIQ